MALAACQVGAPAPSPLPIAPPEAPAVAPSEASQALSRHYARVQEDLVSQGLLRRDTGLDIPLSSSRLAETFLTVALFDEYVRQGDRLVPQATQTVLRRWYMPVRVSLRFGASVPEAQRGTDRRTVAAYTRRLSQATGHPVMLSENRPNFHVFVLNEDERMDYDDELRAALPGIDATTLRTIRTLARDTFCVVFAYGSADTGTFSRALAIVRGEHPDLLRGSCLHEEIAQGLGLVNDSRTARPSIFNDDEEFAYLTGHDELLLSMLYDPRMRPGMTLQQARPIAYQIAAEKLGGES